MPEERGEGFEEFEGFKEFELLDNWVRAYSLTPGTPAGGARGITVAGAVSSS
jgi:hypothetical protein